jgi:hypothetical protein
VYVWQKWKMYVGLAEGDGQGVPANKHLLELLAITYFVVQESFLFVCLFVLLLSFFNRIY